MNAAQWMFEPIARANATAAASTAGAMLLLAAYQPEEHDPAEFVRAYAFLVVMLHALLHAVTLNGLRLMGLLDVAQARSALERYRDPRRVSHLDLAAAWLGYYALTPYIAAL